jgi:hypothetical protein
MGGRIEIDVDFSGWLAKLEELQHPPIMELESIFLAKFQEVQAAVHVITGSLKGSGRTDTDYAEGVWKAEMVFGGPAPGYPHGNVGYALAELARGNAPTLNHPEGGHYYYEPAYDMPELIIPVIEEWLGG